MNWTLEYVAEDTNFEYIHTKHTSDNNICGVLNKNTDV